MVGKTTLAKALAHRLNERGWPHIYRHLSRLPETWRSNVVPNYIRLMNPYVVQDRFHYSEPLYTAATRPREPALLGPSAYDQVERSLRSHCSFLIVITADPELIEERYTEERRKSEMFALDEVLKVNELYRQAASEQRWGAYNTPCDLWLHCTREQPFVEIGEHLNLHIYLNRLHRDFPYPNADRRIA